MENLLEGSDPLRFWYVKTDKKICICYSSQRSPVKVVNDYGPSLKLFKKHYCSKNLP